MKRIEITSPQIRGKAYLGIRDIVGWWSSQKSYDPRYKITEAKLEDTVYFIIKTSGVPNDTKIGLQLYDLEEFFSWIICTLININSMEKKKLQYLACRG